MEFRSSGLAVPVLTLGTGTFGGVGEFFRAFGQRDVADATRLVDLSAAGRGSGQAYGGRPAESASMILAHPPPRTCAA
jgi:hypothetical protein